MSAEPTTKNAAYNHLLDRLHYSKGLTTRVDDTPFNCTDWDCVTLRDLIAQVKALEKERDSLLAAMGRRQKND